MANQPKKYKKFVATAATATLVASAIVPVASAASLSDIAGNTHEEAITALVDAKVISGYPDGTFKPGNKLTRSDVVKLLGKYLVSQGYEIPADAVSNPRFSDLKGNKELSEYAAVVADNGVFSGSNGKLLPADNITRENMAIVLVRMINTLKDVSLEEFVASQNFNGDVKDLNAAKAEARTAIQVLDFYDITNPSVSNFNPKGDTTRGQFATFLYKTINSDFAGASAVTGTVKAINATTVEVTFPEAIADVKDLTFKIDGLEVKNAVVKQTDAKTAVLTTAAQESGKEYTVTVNGNAVGKFTGISAVIPTGISVVERSLQGVLGQQVTVKAQVTVAEGQSKAGIPVTFNVTGTGSLNTPQLFEANTDENGVATYTYTRYANTTDDVVAYATGDRTKYSAGKVYWATAQQLTIKDVTGVNTLANNDSKVYEINSANNANKFVFVTFKENLNVTADKVVRTVGAKGSSTYLLAQNNTITGVASDYPYEISTGAKAVIAVKLDANGKANLVLAGTNATVTPVVYEGAAVDTTVDADNIAGNNLSEFTNASYNATALQASAPAVTFEAKHVLGLTIEAVGVANAATYKNTNETGGRDYTVTYVDKDGKPAKAGSPVQIAIPVQTASNGVFLIDADGNKVYGTTIGEYRVFNETVKGNEGKVKFTVGSEGVTQYVEPIAFIDNGTGIGAKAGLDTTDLQAKGAATHFTDAVTYSTSLTLVDAAGKEIKSVYANGVEKAFFQYETVDQNGKARAYRLADGSTAQTTVTYTVQAGTSPVTVVGYPQLAAGTTNTYNVVIPAGQFARSLEVTASAATTATVSATATVAGLVLGTTNTVGATFTSTSVANVTGTVTAVNKSTGIVTIGSVPYALSGATYLNNGTVVPTLAAFYDHLTVGKTVSVTKDADGNLVFNVTGTAVTPADITSAVLSEDGTKLTLTFAQNIDAALTGALTPGDFTFEDSLGNTITPAGTVVATLNGTNKIVITGLATGELEATDVVTVAADAFVYVGGTANAELTQLVTQPFASKLSVLSVTDASIKAIPSSAAKDAVADVTIDDVTFTVTVDNAGTFKAENYNGIKVKFVAAGTEATPTASYDAINKVITVEVGYAAATNTVADLEAAIAAIAPTATLDFGDITLAVSGTTTSASLVDLLDLTTPVTVTLKDGLSADAGTVGEYTFKLNTNLVAGNKVVLNGKTYTAGTDFVVATTVAGTQANLAQAITDAIAAGTETRFATAIDGSGVITLTDAAATGAATPTLTSN